MKEEKQNSLDDKLLIASYDGDLKTVIECIADGADVNCFDWSDGRFPLLHAAERGHVKIAQALLATGLVDMKDHDGNGNNAMGMALKLQGLVKGRDNKERYSRIANFIFAARGGYFPEMPTLPEHSAHSVETSAMPSPPAP